MNESRQHNSHFYVKIDNKDVSDELAHALEVIRVDSTLHLPDAATLIVHDPRLKWVDDAGVSPGKTLIINARSGESESAIFDGEIVEIESHFADKTHRLHIKAYDRLHRLTRGTAVRTFQNVTDEDVVKKIAGEVGLTAKVTAPNAVHEYLFQANLSNLHFLQQRAHRCGCLLFAEGKELHFESPRSDAKAIELKWGENLLEFRPRWSTLNQVQSATARGWDLNAKKEVMAECSQAQFLPSLGSSKTPAQVVKESFGLEPKALYAHGPVAVQKTAEVIAQAELNRRAHQSVEAEGVIKGNPSVVSGVNLSLSGLGQRFSGTYFVTGAVHVYRLKEGYTTQISISGQNLNSLMGHLQTQIPSTPYAGVVIGIVTDNADPKGIGRVKVRFPWLNSEHNSNWARIVTVGGGNTRGIEYIPEVNDEVAVAFEQGDVNSPYILGGLYNGKDAPPLKSGSAVSGGKVNKRIIQSRSGHMIILDDTSGSESITIQSTGDMTIKADGKILIEATEKVEIKGLGVLVDGGGGNVDVKGTTINLN